MSYNPICGHTTAAPCFTTCMKTGTTLEQPYMSTQHDTLQKSSTPNCILCYHQSSSTTWNQSRQCSPLKGSTILWKKRSESKSSGTILWKQTFMEATIFIKSATPPLRQHDLLALKFLNKRQERNRYRFVRTCYRSSHAPNTRKGNETLSLTQVTRIQCCVASKFRHRSQLSMTKHTHTVVYRIKDRDWKQQRLKSWGSTPIKYGGWAVSIASSLTMEKQSKHTDRMKGSKSTLIVETEGNKRVSLWSW